ncbi:Hypothetical protein FKW44_011585, partial [Caligus rogercresseyi]
MDHYELSRGASLNQRRFQTEEGIQKLVIIDEEVVIIIFPPAALVRAQNSCSSFVLVSLFPPLFSSAFLVETDT